MTAEEEIADLRKKLQYRQEDCSGVRSYVVRAFNIFQSMHWDNKSPEIEQWEAEVQTLGILDVPYWEKEESSEN